MWLATRGRTRHRGVVTGRRSGDVCRSSSLSSSLAGGGVARDVTSAKSSCVKIKSDVTDIDDSALLGQPFAGGDVNDGDDASSSAAAAEEAETPEVKAQREKARRHANNARER